MAWHDENGRDMFFFSPMQKIRDKHTTSCSRNHELINDVLRQYHGGIKAGLIPRFHLRHLEVEREGGHQGRIDEYLTVYEIISVIHLLPQLFWLYFNLVILVIAWRICDDPFSKGYRLCAYSSGVRPPDIALGRAA
ncbi:hypothetical protein C8R48DRAFT_675869 [Suillus tomentosus]|nr:hypothetical protein C8R48DRAFT_675869 [Suillus tomentosus]